MNFQFELFITATTTVFLICGIKFRWFRRSDNLLPPPLTANNNDEGRYCAVCLNDVIGGEKCRKLPKCGHVFHMDCVDAWLECNWTCPLCRRQVTDQLPRRKGEDVISQAEDFIVEKIYNRIMEKVTMVLFGGMFLVHP
ncbi:hypothetical protein RND71_001395 [Anisodus tanguticus]|uniref:RING-type E3 ubiquitin transferase n=1 Tax=Anisodus tanguticus TaxID=243964 RepID=A0AAE1T1D7_9SOLA|nr:hypothetical protein RND71_001395 [Anisodus tanguticus]